MPANPRNPPPSATPGPSPTPPDLEFPYPFEDDGDDDNWEGDFGGLLRGPWAAEWWDRSGSGAGQCNGGDIFTGPGYDNGRYPPANSPKATSTESDIAFPRNSHSHWKTLTSAPHANVNAAFCARFSGSFNLQAGDYRWRIRRDQGVLIYVNEVNRVNNWTCSGAGCSSEFTVDMNGLAGGTYQIVILFRDNSTTSNARLFVQLERVGETYDQGECNWQSIPNPNHAATEIAPRSGGNGTYWSDSPTGNYAPDTFCILRLRGTVDLRSATAPYVDWYDAWEIGVGDVAYFAIREAGTDTWFMKNVHDTGTSSGNWVRQEPVRLTNMENLRRSDTGALLPDAPSFNGRVVEMAFILDTDGSSEGRGWFITEFRIFQQEYRLFNIGFTDNFSNVDNWVPDEGDSTWGTTTERVSSAPTSITDRPNTNTQNNDDTWLRLDGLLDLTTANVINPELVFYQSVSLGTGDYGYVEASTNEGVTWTALKTSQSAPNHVAEGSTPTWSPVVIPLDNDAMGQNYIGRRIFLRFRLVTNGTNNSTGWFIDNFEFRQRVETFALAAPWCDEMEVGSALWDSGDWQITSESVYSGTGAWSDSPNGSYPNNRTNTLQLKVADNIRIDLTQGNWSTTYPVMEFWHRWQLGTGDTIRVEATNNNWSTATTLWSRTHNEVPANYPSTNLVNADGWAEQNGWVREEIPLNNYTTSTAFKFRFVLVSDGSTNDDGWFIDSICVRPKNATIVNLPFQDQFSDTSNWYVGGQWERDAVLQYNDRASMATRARTAGSTPLPRNTTGRRNYEAYYDNILELRGIINLSGSPSQPTLYIWDRYEIEGNDYAYVEVMPVNAQGLPAAGARWQIVSRTGSSSSALNWAFTRRQIDLSAYNGQYLRLRFRFQALTSGNSMEGWHIDSVRVATRASDAIVMPLPFEDTVSFDAINWVREGEWTTIEEYRSLQSGSLLGPGAWRADYFANTVGSRPTFPPTPFVTDDSSNITDINFDWGSTSTSAPAEVLATNPNGNKADRWMARYTRILDYDSDVTFLVTVNSDDGHRFLVNTGIQTPVSGPSGCGGSGTWDDSGNCTASYRFTVPAAGTTTIQVEFYENSGGAKVSAVFTLESGVIPTPDPFGSGSWNITYHASCAGLMQATPWNSVPEVSQFVNFIYTSGAPSVVTSNINVTPGEFIGSNSVASPFNGSHTVVMEAENFTNQTNSNFQNNPRYWEPTTTYAAQSSGGVAMVANPDGGQIQSGSLNLSDPTASLSYDLNLTASGTYRVWIRAYGPSSDSDSVWVGFDGGSGIQMASPNGRMNVPTSAMDWRGIADGGSNMTINVTNVNAPNILTIFFREDGVVVDKILLTRDSDAPTTFGPAESARTNAACAPFSTNPNEGWYARYTRNVTVNDPYTVIFNISSNDRHRLWVNGSVVSAASAWTGSGAKTSSTTVTFNPGTTPVVIEYFAGSIADSNFIRVQYDLLGRVFHTDPQNLSDANGDSSRNVSASIIFEGVFDLTANPTLTWWDSHDIGVGDAIVVEIATNGGFDAAVGAASPWTELYRRDGEHISLGWTRRIVSLTGYAGQDVVIRFRLITNDPSGNANDVKNGWLIDDISVVD